MKILVLQITRFGDILCTLPVLSALRRANPEAEIHFLVRQKFVAAAEKCPHIDHLWKLDAAKILSPFIGGSGEMTEALGTMTTFVNELRAQKFDRIVNLSFSPSSSFLTHMISNGETSVSGYTRTNDLFLHIPDQPSQYFRAQVGLGRHSRLHVVDLMAWIAGVKLQKYDWEQKGASHREGVVCHPGASSKEKRWPELSWVTLINRLIESGETVTIIGTHQEKDFTQNIVNQVVTGLASEKKSRLRNLVGKTSFVDLMDSLSKSKLFIGADSGPLHGATLADCKALNLSVGNVRFWETGPLVLGSRILVSDEPQLLGSDIVYEQARQILRGENTKLGYIECVRESGIRYEVHPGAHCPNDSWQLVDWIYFDGDRPKLTGPLVTALSQMHEVCSIACSQLESFRKNPGNLEVVNVLDRLDDLLEIFRTNITPLSPLLDAFRTQKENIPPGSRDEVFSQTGKCYQQLKMWVEDLIEILPNQTAAVEAKG